MDKSSHAGAGKVVVLVGTRKGLFVMASSLTRKRWKFSGPYLAGYEVYHAFIDPRPGGIAYAATSHPVWGVHLHRSSDGGHTWEVTSGTPQAANPNENSSIEAIWYVAPGHSSQPDLLYAGVQPAGLFISEDGAASWRLVEGLAAHPTRATWQPARGGLALHSIYVDPRDARRIYVAVSAGGVYRSDDGGASWKPINQGVRADYLPDPLPPTGHCVHRIVVHAGRPDRLYQQSHTGTYRSDDRGESWTEITEGLPSDFGYAIATDPRDADTVFVIPEESSHMRTTVGGAITVYRSRDAGGCWEPLTKGLPRKNAYVTILRESIDTDGLEPCGIYFGTSSGHLFASADGGASWDAVAGFLPKILSVNAIVLDAS